MFHVALDTSLGCSLAIADEGGLLAEATLPGTGRDNDQKLTDWIVQTLQSHQLKLEDVTHWTAGIGPGSFAGLRYGVALLKGIIAVTGAKLRGVPSSYALACAVSPVNTETGGRIGVIQDARCGQVLLSVYVRENSALRPLMAPIVLDPDPLLLPEYACGQWVTAQAPMLPPLPHTVDDALCRLERLQAAALLQASAAQWPWPTTEAEITASCEPLYVRPPVFVAPRITRTFPQ